MEFKMQPKATANFGVIGLTDESKSILLGMHERGYVGCVYDFSHDNVKAFLENEAKDTKIIGAQSLEEMIMSLKKTRCIVMFVEEMMIQDFIGVGLAVDDFIDLELLPHMSYQDYLIDASSSGREDSQEKVKDLMEKGIRYIGMKEGASIALLQGMCICLENENFWDRSDMQVRPARMFGEDNKHDVAAIKSDVEFCCYWGIPGHKQLYIEYTVHTIREQESRLYREAEGLLSKIGDLKKMQLNGVLREWCKGDLNSKWCQSSKYKSISYLSELNEDQRTFVGHVEKALLTCQVLEYAQGFASIRELAELHQWDIDYTKLKLSWPQDYHYKLIKAAFTKNPQLENLLLDEYFAKVVNEGLPSMREVVARATDLLNKVEKFADEIFGLSVEGFKEALVYYEDFTANKPLCARLFDMQLENEEPMEELDLGPLYKYQYQLRGLQAAIGKIEKTIKKLNENTEGDDSNSKWRIKVKLSSIGYFAVTKNIETLHGEPKLIHRACMKHMEKDEQVILHTKILSKRIDHVKNISKDYLSEQPETCLSKYPRVLHSEYDYDYEREFPYLCY